MKIYDLNGKESGKVDLPKQFNEEVRPDIIKKAVLAIRANKRQKYGAYKEAGQRHCVTISKMRRDYRSVYGSGRSRTPRKVMSVRGSRFNWVGAVVPNTVGGRRAHPPKAEKDWTQKINKKENRLAIRSALSATLISSMVRERGHIIPEIYPFVLDNKINEIAKTKEFIDVLFKLGFEQELARSQKRIIRAGKGKLRGRKYITKKSILIVVIDKRCKLAKAAKNVPGIDLINVANLNAELLAPGTHIGRATLFTKEAIEKIGKENLFN
ncbi:50S ribosomal protein L4 [Candidatus Woesearchaeota archaeon]|nr:50S ribosomal protein L4 [Candidatus Woesearchaeota archaeon]